MIRRSSSQTDDRRRGLAAMWAVVVLAAMSAIVGTVTVQLILNRRTLDSQLDQAQGLWLARAGVELGVGGLLNDPKAYHGETREMLPGWQVRIEVQAEKDAADTYRITGTARHQVGKATPTVCSASRRFRRTSDGGKVSLVALAPADER